MFPQLWTSAFSCGSHKNGGGVDLTELDLDRLQSYRCGPTSGSLAVSSTSRACVCRGRGDGNASTAAQPHICSDQTLGKRYWKLFLGFQRAPRSIVLDPCGHDAAWRRTLRFGIGQLLSEP